MKYAKNLFVVGLIISLFGCQTTSTAQREYDQIMSNVKKSKEKWQSCSEKMILTESYKKISNEVLYSKDDSPNKISLMMSDEYLSNDQLDALKQYIIEALKCRPFTYELAPYNTRIAFINYYNQIDSVYLKLARREISIGSANTEKDKLVRERQKNLDSAWQMDMQRLNDINKEEMANQRANAAALAPYLLQQQQINQQIQQQNYNQQMNAIRNNQPRPPINTNCTTIGNNTNCISR